MFVSMCPLGCPGTGSEVTGLEARQHGEDEVSKRGVLGDEEARRVHVRVLQRRLLLRGDVLLLGAVPELLQAGPGQRDAGPRAVHGLALQEPPLLFVQLSQDSHTGLVLEGLSRGVSGHVGVAEVR